MPGRRMLVGVVVAARSSALFVSDPRTAAAVAQQLSILAISMPSRLLSTICPSVSVSFAILKQPTSCTGSKEQASPALFTALPCVVEHQ
jgi:hypothetical protein